MRALGLIAVLMVVGCAATQPDLGSEGSGGFLPGTERLVTKSLLGAKMDSTGGALTGSTLTLSSTVNPLQIPTNGEICLDGAACVRTIVWNGSTITLAATTAAVRFASSQSTGNNAFQVDTNGARVDFGAGASDYASSDGTTVTFAGPISTASSVTSTGSGFIGVYVKPTAGALPTCGAGLDGRIYNDSTGGTGSVYTKICGCRFDGTTYKYFNLFNPSVTTGTTTTCPN